MKRINLKFSDNDDNQQKAYKILQNHTYNKTQFISDCIVYYTEHNGELLGTTENIKNSIKEIVTELLSSETITTQTKQKHDYENKPQINQVKETDKSDTNLQNKPHDDTLDNDTVNLLLDGLNCF